MSVTVVPAEAGHLDEVAAIYARTAESSPATFDLEGKPLEWWERALAHSDPVAGHLLVVALDSDHVLGYAKSSEFRDKPAYSTTAEVSVYVDEPARERGVGHALYADLIGRLERSELLLAAAGITEPNPASTRLHVAHGFERVGTFQRVGVKFGRAWDVTWYQRSLEAALG